MSWLDNPQVGGNELTWRIQVVTVKQKVYSDMEESVYAIARKSREDIGRLPIQFQQAAYKHLDEVIAEMWAQNDRVTE